MDNSKLMQKYKIYQIIFMLISGYQSVLYCIFARSFKFENQ